MSRLASIVVGAAIASASLFAQSPTTGLISGTVIDTASGDPVRKAVVTVTLQGEPRRWATTRTDGSGHFEFNQLPAGKYDLRARTTPEGVAIYGVNDARGLSELITLNDGQTLGGVTLRFLHFGSIAGRVYDSDGDPVVSANVSVLRRGRNRGAPILVNYRGTSTDDRGDYRIAGLDPGRYYLRVTPPQSRFGGQSTENLPPQLVDEYFNGAKSSKDAAPLQIHSGEILSGQDFRLHSERPTEARGRIIGVPAESPPAQPARPGGPAGVAGSFVGPYFGLPGAFGDAGNGPPVQVKISTIDFGPVGMLRSTFAPGPDYRFQFPGIASGIYRVEAATNVGEKIYAGSQVIDLQEGSGDIVLTLVPALDIQGTLRIEGQLPREDQPLRGAPAVASSAQRLNGNGFRVELGRPGTAASSITSPIGPDGKFTLKQVPPGEWQVAVTPPSPGFLKSALLGEKDVRFATFEIGPGNDSPLSIVVSMHTATVEGEVKPGSSDTKRAGIIIAPIAGPLHALTRFYYTATADDAGIFKVTGIAPGEYKIYALEKMDAARFMDADLLDPLDDLGDAIDLTDGAKITAHPKLIPFDRARKALE